MSYSWWSFDQAEQTYYVVMRKVTVIEVIHKRLGNKDIRKYSFCYCSGMFEMFRYFSVYNMFNSSMPFIIVYYRQFYGFVLHT